MKRINETIKLWMQNTAFKERPFFFSSNYGVVTSFFFYPSAFPLKM
jgi:hypothetical protein